MTLKFAVPGLLLTMSFAASVPPAFAEHTITVMNCVSGGGTYEFVVSEYDGGFSDSADDKQTIAHGDRAKLTCKGSGSCDVKIHSESGWTNVQNDITYTGLHTYTRELLASCQ